MFIVAFLNTDEIDFLKVTIGPYPTEEVAEGARLDFIRHMDQDEGWSSVWSGDVLPLVPYPEAIRQMES